VSPGDLRWVWMICVSLEPCPEGIHCRRVQVAPPFVARVVDLELHQKAVANKLKPADCDFHRFLDA
jgi:hypothetical protein